MNPTKQYENGVPENGLLLVYQIFQNQAKKTYSIAIDLRDYQNHYCSMMGISKEFVSNIMAKVAVAESLGYTEEKRCSRVFEENIGDDNK